MTESCDMKVSERALHKQILLNNDKYLYMYILEL